MLGVVEYIVDLLAALVHLRIFEIRFGDDCPIKDHHRFIMKLSDRVPHLEYISTLYLEYCCKRVGGELAICDPTEFPLFG